MAKVSLVMAGRPSRAAFPVRVGGLSHIAEIVAGEFSVYALDRDRTVWAWGDNSAGQLGNLCLSGTAMSRSKCVT
jgi:alpha-tubulin suppressor-like RCC1 family protein